MKARYGAAVKDTTFLGPTLRTDIFLKARGSQVAMAAAIHPIDYANLPTQDLIEMARLHLQALNFTGLKADSRGTALAALIGIRIAGK